MQWIYELIYRSLQSIIKVEHKYTCVSLQVAPILAKTSPTFNVFVYALGNENYRGGIWQLLTGQKIEPSASETKLK